MPALGKATQIGLNPHTVEAPQLERRFAYISMDTVAHQAELARQLRVGQAFGAQ